MTFHNEVFPEGISYGASGGPQFSTTILELASGYENRNINWQKVKASYNVAFGIRTRSEMEEVYAFFMACFGRAYSFRFKDHSDYRTGAQILGVGDGVQTVYQMKKRYTSGAFYYDRDITKPIDGTLGTIAVNGVNLTEGPDFTIDYNSGLITFDTAPADTHEITMTDCEFHVHARFDIDKLEVVHDFWEHQTIPDINIVEIKE